MKLVLGYHPRGSRSLTFDTDTGRGRLWWFRRAPSVRPGWAMRYRGTWYAVWHDGERHVFQAGKRQIPITNATRCLSEQHGHSRRFAIVDRASGDVVFELVYVETATAPNFDYMERELENLFAYAAKAWRS